MRLSAFPDEPRCLPATECECGNPKPKQAEACARCVYLDGTARDGFVIDAMRGTDGLSLVELAAATGKYRESLQRTMKRLIEVGRVRRFVGEPEVTESVRSMFGRETKRARVGKPDHWVYILDGRAA